MTLEESFRDALEQSLKQAEETRLYNPARLRALAERFGAVEAVKGLAGKGRTSDGFSALQDAKRLDLSPEALVISRKFGPLFTDAEADFCLQALLDAGYFG